MGAVSGLFRLTIGRRFFVLVAVAGLIMLGGTGFAILSFRDALIAAGIPVGDVNRRIIDIVFTLTVTVGPVGMGFLVLAFWLGRGVSRPLSALTGSLHKLAAGDLDAAVEGDGRGDEIGAIARAVATFRERLKLKVRDDAARESAAKDAAEAERRAMLKRLAGEFEASVNAVAGRVKGSAESMVGTAGKLSEIARAAERDATGATALAVEARQRVDAAAQAAAMLAQTATDVSGEVSTSVDMAERAVKEAKDTDGIVRGLASAADQIGTIVELIRSIAEQTNLLALNATIEAARAGDAGRGFAVVANEVKTLSGQTGKATESISAEISAVQSATGQAVGAISAIGDTIARIEAISADVSRAVNGQVENAKEISDAIADASALTNRMSDGLAHLREAAVATEGSSVQVVRSAEELVAEAQRLAGEANGFLARLTAA